MSNPKTELPNPGGSGCDLGHGGAYTGKFTSLKGKLKKRAKDKKINRTRKDTEETLTDAGTAGTVILGSPREKGASVTHLALDGTLLCIEGYSSLLGLLCD